ncbi:MAG: hypothetical protein LBU88_09230 [Treponema sp.]|jgi:hypothetical protein|nr:hypothetical protein [Treponema sp.]
MEELQSTELLEREILDDARKKALRILKAADDTILEKTKEWDDKTTESINDLEEKYSKQKKIAAEKIMARLPIDKLRAKAEKTENLLQDAVKDWYESLDRKLVLKILNDELNKRLELCRIPPAASKDVYYSGLDINEVLSIIKPTGDSYTFKEISSASCYPLITMETENFNIIASIQKIIDYYLAEKREELVEALVGRDFMEEL